MPFNLPSLSNLVYMVVAFLIALSGHEFAHGMVADWLGDPTARRSGRLTLNPLAHVDILGLLALILLRFGWAKPVPVNPFMLKGNRRLGMIAVSLAGPVANLLMAFLGAMAGILLFDHGLGNSPAGALTGEIVVINVMLAVFNLIPIPPLDGSKILAAVLPGRQEWLIALDRYGVVILIVLLYVGVLNIIWQPINAISNGLYNLSYLLATVFH